MITLFKNSKSDYKELNNRSTINDLFISVISVFIVLFSYTIGSGPVSTFLFLFVAISSFIVYRNTYSTPLNAKGLFSLIWFGSISLACLRIHPNQVEWSYITWLCIAVVYPVFTIGFNLSSISNINRTNRHTIDYDKKSIITILTYFSILIEISFVADILFSKGIPIISSSMSAYKDFGMPYVHYITVSSGLFPGLTYICFKVTNLSFTKNKILIFQTVFISMIPFLIVSGQLIILEFIILFFAFVIYGQKEQKISYFKLLVTGFVIILIYIVYVALFRKQNSLYLISTFNLPGNPNKIEVSLWRLYLYIAFNFDNFNYLVDHLTSFSYGLNTFNPVLVFTAAKGLIPDSLINNEAFRLLPTYNTYPFIYDGYRDFGVSGIVFNVLFIGILSGSIEHNARTKISPFNGILYCLLLYSICICFFISEFSQPVFWVYVAILFVLSVVYHSLSSRNSFAN